MGYQVERKLQDIDKVSIHPIYTFLRACFFFSRSFMLNPTYAPAVATLTLLLLFVEVRPINFAYLREMLTNS